MSTNITQCKERLREARSRLRMSKTKNVMFGDDDCRFTRKFDENLSRQRADQLVRCLQAQQASESLEKDALIATLQREMTRRADCESVAQSTAENLQKIIEDLQNIRTELGKQMHRANEAVSSSRTAQWEQKVLLDFHMAQRMDLECGFERVEEGVEEMNSRVDCLEGLMQCLQGSCGALVSKAETQPAGKMSQNSPSKSTSRYFAADLNSTLTDVVRLEELYVSTKWQLEQEKQRHSQQVQEIAISESLVTVNAQTSVIWAKDAEISTLKAAMATVLSEASEYLDVCSSPALVPKEN